ncbi:glutamate-5-semialdehyde dehydrogenase [Candidatus Margulisiibacteriota bacterium]
MLSIKEQCQKAYQASFSMSGYDTNIKNTALKNMAELIIENTDYILRENKKDLELGEKNNTSKALLDRLALTEERLKGIADGLQIIQDLPDPIGDILDNWVRPNGLKISKIRVPIGVIGIIYEARPNVTVDAVGLTLKSGNCVVLRGSSSAYSSNKALVTVLKKAAEKTGINPDCIQLLEDTARESVNDFLKMNEFLDVIIPRGGKGLIQNVIKNATVPTIETGEGNCHVYVDKAADIANALKITIDAKTNRPSVCNAAETLLVHKDIASEFLPKALSSLQKAGVEIRGCTKAKAFDSNIILATEEDWETEYLDLIMAVKVVDSLKEAIEHINKFNTKHTEAIISKDEAAINQFEKEVDASAIIVNASTRFTDGGEFGFGAEMGISTQKLHARGPMGLPELTSYKYIVEGNGQIRS